MNHFGIDSPFVVLGLQFNFPSLMGQEGSIYK
jgi:hypothetical protein